MFAVIYRRFVFPECEKEYQAAWRQVATYFKEHKGALGSCLHRTDKKMNGLRIQDGLILKHGVRLGSEEKDSLRKLQLPFKSLKHVQISKSPMKRFA